MAAGATLIDLRSFANPKESGNSFGEAPYCQRGMADAGSKLFP